MTYSRLTVPLTSVRCPLPWELQFCDIIGIHAADSSGNTACHLGRVQLASDFGKRLRAAISCHFTQTSPSEVFDILALYKSDYYYYYYYYYNKESA